MNRILNFINLHNGEEDKTVVLNNVTANISFRGSNLWILACAILIASIGLNVNSTAVIIGAMLISPLMGPIVGAGFALGTYNFPLLKKSIKNLLIATFVSLLVSGVYFFVSPFKDVQSELLARTAPNIYDVMIAFFGGLVGVIAITRVEKGNPIPGVAIATALMPPLCTAGFGIATFNLNFFLGAFYLYTINCFFICIATFLVVKYLRYPSVFINKKYEKRVKYSITILMLIITIPSFFLAYNLFQEKKFSKAADHFIEKQFDRKGYTIIYKKINYNVHPRTIDLAFLDKKFSQSEIKSFNSILAANGLNNTKLIIRQDSDELKSEMIKEISKTDNTLTEKDLAISTMRKELDTYKVTDSTLSLEIKALYPNIRDLSYGRLVKNPSSDSTKVEFVLVYSGNQVDRNRLADWLKLRLDEKNIIVIQTNESARSR